MSRDIFLFISDLQTPFEHRYAFDFCRYLKRHYKIKNENCYCVGDETDQLFGGMWKKDINGTHTALSEIKETKDKFKQWYEEFPELKIATSNHGLRWQRKALESDIPSVLLRRYEEVLGSPPGWVWKKHWLIKAKYPMLMEHGDSHGGQYPHVSSAISNGVSTIIGHHHTIAGVEHIKTNGMSIWGMCTGSLIDFESYVFNYARDGKRKPQLGCGVVFDSGRKPVWEPLKK